jgi:hypothetical protein
MFVTLVAVLCTVGSPTLCQEEIVTDSSLDSMLTWQGCLMSAQAGLADWMSKHPVYRTGYTLQRWKCVPGHYAPAGRA